MAEIPARLSIVTLGAWDMGVLRSFYRGLGWTELRDGDESWTGFLLGGVLLALFPMRDLTAEAAPGSRPRGRVSAWRAPWTPATTSTGASPRPWPPVRPR
jgi:hypothetical protein